MRERAAEERNPIGLLGTSFPDGHEGARPLITKDLFVIFTLTVMMRRATPLIMKEIPVTFTLRQEVVKP